MPEEKSKLVYSTDRAVPRDKGPAEKPPQTVAPAAQQKVTVRLERKGRGGKTVPVGDGLRLRRGKAGELLRQLKTKLGAGGALKDASIEIQGDHREAVISALKGMGFPP
ncbi:MAG: translation initiation factor, partial [Nitrospiraceae bacterium]|nr:translation initiation factor [Nitrospiraceae bacterium]